MKLIVVPLKILCALAVVILIGGSIGLITLSESQHPTTAAFAGCPSGTLLNSATLDGGKLGQTGEGNVSISIKSQSGVRSAGASIAAKSGYVVKSAAIYSDPAGKDQVGAANGSDVTSVRVGQTNRSAQVVRADACVKKAGIKDHAVSVIHFVGRMVAALIIITTLMVFLAGYFTAGFIYRRRHQHAVVSPSTSPVAA